MCRCGNLPFFWRLAYHSKVDKLIYCINWVQFQVQAQNHKMARRYATLRHLGPQNYTAPLTMYLHAYANFQPNWRSQGSDTARKRKAPSGVNIHLKVQVTVTPKKVKTLTGDTKWHSKFQPNMISSFQLPSTDKLITELSAISGASQNSQNGP